MEKISIDNSWTLFLDRDGVINQQKDPGYILNWNEFVFLDAVLDALRLLAEKFQHIFIITNQRGVGKGDMTITDLDIIHKNLLLEVSAAGGRIDKIYFCPDVLSASPCRKPNAGMALQAKEEYPDIDFTKSIMVGNSLSDMEFGRNIGAVTIFLSTTNKHIDKNTQSIDHHHSTLIEFAKTL